MHLIKKEKKRNEESNSCRRARSHKWYEVGCPGAMRSLRYETGIEQLNRQIVFRVVVLMDRGVLLMDRLAIGLKTGKQIRLASKLVTKS